MHPIHRARSPRTLLDTADLAAGVYLLNVSTRGTFLTKKFVVSR